MGARRGGGGGRDDDGGDATSSGGGRADLGSGSGAMPSMPDMSDTAELGLNTGLKPETIQVSRYAHVLDMRARLFVSLVVLVIAAVAIALYLKLDFSGVRSTDKTILNPTLEANTVLGFGIFGPLLFYTQVA